MVAPTSLFLINSLFFFLNEEILKVKAHRLEMKNKIKQFRKDFLSMKHTFPEIFDEHRMALENSANNLFDRRILNIIAGKEVPLSRGKAVLPEEVGDIIFLKVIEGPFSSFEEAIRVFSGDPEKYENEEARLMMSQWSDLMIDFYGDLMKLELVSPQNLSLFQKKDQGQFFASLIIAKYPQFDVNSTYLNFDLRLSIAEDPNLKTEKLKEIFLGWSYVLNISYQWKAITKLSEPIFFMFVFYGLDRIQ